MVTVWECPCFNLNALAVVGIEICRTVEVHHSSLIGILNMKRTSAALIGGLVSAGRPPSPHGKLQEHRQNGLRSLRDSCGKPPGFADSVINKLTRIGNAMSAYFFVTGGSSKRMCKNYGHLTPSSFKGPFPKCEECGILITDPSQVRGSSLRSESK
jgi:hypothetical protein